MPKQITQDQVELLVTALLCQADACQATAKAMEVSARSALIEGSSTNARIHTASAAGMREFASAWTQNAMDAEYDPEKATYLLRKCRPSKMARKARKDLRVARKSENRVERQIERATLQSGNDLYIRTLRSEALSRKVVRLGWERAALLWEALRDLY